MTDSHAIVTFTRTGGKATQPPNPAYPDGIDFRACRPGEKTCTFALPYPAEGIGFWTVECRACGYRAGITAAGRADDPRSVTVACKPRGSLQ